MPRYPVGPRSKVTSPIFSLIPYSLTILRAMSVIFMRSLWAPVEASENTITSAARPPEERRELTLELGHGHEVTVFRGGCSV